MILLTVCKAFDERKLPYAVAGGTAVALHGAVRGTVDLDLVLRLKKMDFIAAEAILSGLGFRPRLPVKAEEVFDFREEYRKNRNLIAWTFVHATNPSEIVDIILTEDLGKLTTRSIVIQGHPVRVLTKKSLIAMKRRSGRPQDLEDVRALEALDE